MLVAEDTRPERGSDRDPCHTAALESRVRRIVADRLGVTPCQLLPDTSLADDMAVDSLDLLEIAIAIEAEAGVSIAERQLESVRTYGELATLVATLVADRSSGSAAIAPAVVTRVVAGNRTTLQRTGFLTPYAVETIAEDAIAAGRGARLEVALRGPAVAGALECVRLLFARLGTRGIRVQVNVDHDARLVSGRPAA
ncbi:MAG TPA: phosphopantetheine-binding protein [Candidatus Binatia bacterium]|nr:phosphopantetheine-binding protein [Candidatus Binatia bacterium]